MTCHNITINNIYPLILCHYLCDGVCQSQHSSNSQHTLYAGLALKVTLLMNRERNTSVELIITFADGKDIKLSTSKLICHGNKERVTALVHTQ